MKRKNIILKQVARYFILSLAAFFLYILQSTPGFLQVFGIKPVFLFAFAITLSLMDENWQTGLVFVICGLLADLSAGKAVGFYTLQLMTACACGAVAAKFFLKVNKTNCFIFSFAATAIMLTIDLFFSFMMGDFIGKTIYFLTGVLITGAYSSVFSIPFYYFIDFINRRFKRFDAR